MSLADT